MTVTVKSITCQEAIVWDMSITVFGKVHLNNSQTVYHDATNERTKKYKQNSIKLTIFTRLILKDQYWWKLIKIDW